MDDILGMLTARRASDQLRGVVRLSAGGEERVLPALTIAESEAWIGSLDATLASIVDAAAATADGSSPEEELALLLSALAAETPVLVTALADYDRTGVLGGVDGIRAAFRAGEVIAALLQIWRAANPLADIALLGMATSGTSSARTSPPPQPGAPSPLPSAPASPPSSSPASSTRRPSGSSASSTSGSRRRAPAGSSRTTGASTTGTGRASRRPGGGAVRRGTP